VDLQPEKILPSGIKTLMEEIRVVKGREKRWTSHPPLGWPVAH